MVERVFLTSDEAAKVLGCGRRTLVNMRSRREGPVFVKYGRRVFYDLADVYAWLDSHKVETAPTVSAKAELDLAEAIGL